MKNCKYCDFDKWGFPSKDLMKLPLDVCIKIGGKGVTVKDVNVDVGLSNDNGLVFAMHNEDCVSKSIKINFCPMCGRKLEKEEK